MDVASGWTGRQAAALRHAHRMSIRAYAAHLGVTISTVSNWDSRGEHARLRTETQQLLDIDLKRASGEVRERFAALLASETGDMKRRGFLVAGSAAVGGTLAAAMPAHGRVSVASPRPAGASVGLSRAILSPGGTAARSITAAAMTIGAEQAWRLRQRAEYEALGTLLSDLIPRAEASVVDMRGQEVARAGQALVHVYNAASSLLKRLGDDSLAAVAADRAVRAAASLDSAVLTAAAKYRLANVLLAAGRLDEARTVALDGTRLVEPGRASSSHSLATWGGLLLTAAVTAARQSDRSRAWELLGEARTAAHLLGRDHADMYAIFGPTNLAIHCVQVAVELGDGYDAVRRGDHVNPNDLPESLVERRGQFLIDMAHAHALVRDAHAAATALLEAERVAPQEVRLSSDAHDVVRGLLTYPRVGRVPELRALAARIGFDQ